MSDWNIWTDVLGLPDSDRVRRREAGTAVVDSLVQSLTRLARPPSPAQGQVVRRGRWAATTPASPQVAVTPRPPVKISVPAVQLKINGTTGTVDDFIAMISNDPSQALPILQAANPDALGAARLFRVLAQQYPKQSADRVQSYFVDMFTTDADPRYAAGKLTEFIQIHPDRAQSVLRALRLDLIERERAQQLRDTLIRLCPTEYDDKVQQHCIQAINQGDRARYHSDRLAELVTYDRDRALQIVNSVCVDALASGDAAGLRDMLYSLCPLEYAARRGWPFAGYIREQANLAMS